MAGPYYVTLTGNDTNTGLGDGDADAWLTIQKAADTIVAGETVYIKGNRTLTAEVDFDTNDGTSLIEIRYKGYVSTIEDTGLVEVDESGAVASLFDVVGKDYLRFENFRLTSGDTSGMKLSGTTAYNKIENCELDTNGTNGIYMLGGPHSIRNCEFYSNGTYGLYFQGNQRLAIFGNYFHDESYGFRNQTSVDVRLRNNIFEACSTMGCWYVGNANADTQMIGNTFDACVLGLVFGDNTDRNINGVLVYNNLFTNNTTAGIKEDTTDASVVVGLLDYNAYHTNGTDVLGVVLSKGANAVDLTADPYTNRAGHDFSLNSTDGGGSACKGAGLDFVGTLASSIGTNCVDIGALQAIPLGAPTTPTFGGITSLERIAQGLIKVSWSAGSGTITGYKIFVRKGSAPSFTDTYLWGIVDNARTSVIIDTEEDNDTMLYGDEAIYVGVRAYNDGGDGVADAGTTTLNLTPDAGLMLNNAKIQVLDI